MKFIPTKLAGLRVVQPEVHEDVRGYFFESYSKKVFIENGIADDFVQDNHSVSHKGVLRGLHYQVAPQEQAKLVCVAAGSAFDVVVDLRKGSKTFGQHVGEILSAENKKMIYIPAGFAHGFCALEDDTHFLYKVSSEYSLVHERGVLWNDSDLAIVWPRMNVEYRVSEKDKKLPHFKQIAF